MPAFFSQLNSYFHLFHFNVLLHFFCWVVFFHVTHVTQYTAPFHLSACENHIFLWSRVPGYCLQKELLKCITSWLVFPSQSKVDLFFHFIPNNLKWKGEINTTTNIEVREKKSSTLYQFSR